MCVCVCLCVCVFVCVYVVRMGSVVCFLCGLLFIPLPTFRHYIDRTSTNKRAIWYECLMLMWRVILLPAQPTISYSPKLECGEWPSSAACHSFCLHVPMRFQERNHFFCLHTYLCVFRNKTGDGGNIVRQLPHRLRENASTHTQVRVLIMLVIVVSVLTLKKT